MKIVCLRKHKKRSGIGKKRFVHNENSKILRFPGKNGAYCETPFLVYFCFFKFCQKKRPFRVLLGLFSGLIWRHPVENSAVDTPYSWKKKTWFAFPGKKPRGKWSSVLGNGFALTVANAGPQPNEQSPFQGSAPPGRMDADHCNSASSSNHVS